ncbi:MAG: translational GTPase TypA [Dehalococcoidia bacterium]|nr:translational GTPase TypA [Dehalococcoidia bacterium]
MSIQPRSDIRNIAIIAHVDHGKTTLVDGLLKQSHTFRANQQMGELIMDSNPLERERGITILAKNTAIVYKGVKINIIDTPGHADFSGEVERVINMADGCLLVVDALDGPMPQTRYVLKQALGKGLKPVVVINKIDRPNARPAEVVSMVQDLFLELATEAEQLEFPILFASAKQGYAVAKMADMENPERTMEPLFQAIIEHVPAPLVDAEGPLQMLVTTLAYDNHIGQVCVGRVFRGRITPGMPVTRVGRDGRSANYKIEKVFIFTGLERREIDAVEAGDIAAVAGVADASIGDTIASVEVPEALPPIIIEEPTVKMSFGVNTSPFAGQDGTAITARQLQERLARELRTNVSLRVQPTDQPDIFMVSGRGELHLAILIENIRREGVEIQVSKPEAVTKVVDGRVTEPYEMLVMDTREEFIGPVTENMSTRLAQMTNMQSDGQGNVRMEFKIPTRGLIGFRSYFLKVTRGNGVMSTQLLGYEPMRGAVKTSRTGVLLASESGIAVAYGLNIAQGRGSTFVEPGTSVYEGMVVGANSREDDIVVNICKEKKMTNIRSSTSDIAVRLTPAVKMSLEESLDFIEGDELVECTPKNLRIRKKTLHNDQRHRERGSRERAVVVEEA